MSNQATAYDVGIVPAVVEPGRPFWRAVDVRHLTPAENRGKHHVFVDIVDEAGRPVRDPKLRIGWTWDGRQPSEPAPPQPLDKSPSEPAGNVELASTRQVTTVWISDFARPSDAVEGLHTNHAGERGPSGELWNSVGHHSFYVRFQLTLAGGQPTEPPADTAEKRLAALEARQAASEAWQKTVERHLQQMLGEL